MKNKITMGFIAAAAIIAFAFTAPKNETTYTVDTKATTATWLAKKVTGQHTGTVNIFKGAIVVNDKTITGGKIEFDMASIADVDLG
jgi:hypothetical protein